LYLTIVSIAIVGVSICGIAKSMVAIAISISESVVSISSVQESWVSLSLSLPLDKGVGDDGASSNSKGSSVRVLLLVKSRGREKSGNLMNSSNKISVVSSLGLVSSNSNGDWEVGGGHLSLELKRLDSIGEGRGGIGVSKDTSTIDSGIGKTSIHKGRVSLSLPLTEVVVDNWGVGEGTSSGAQAHVSARLLLLDSEGRDKSGNLMDRSSEVSIGSSNSLVSSNSNRDRVTGNHGSSRDDSSMGVWESIDTSSVWVSSVQEGRVSLRGSMGSNCQQYTGKNLHCSSVAWLLLTLGQHGQQLPTIHRQKPSL